MAEVKSSASAGSVQAANPLKSAFPVIAIVACFVVAYILYKYVLGAAGNFEGGNPDGHPISTEVSVSKHYLGLIYKGGFIVPLGLTLLLTVIVFTVERMLTLGRAGGKGNVDAFMFKLRGLIQKEDIEGAIKECDKQSGSLGNVVKSTLRKYEEMTKDTSIDKETKKEAIQAEHEKATMLELPGLERNLPIIATVASLGTLVGLIGTVLGMIRSFSALGAGGAPNAAELSVGISEALVNTALGITTSALAILLYNFFTTRIDGMTYRMDEVGYSIVHTFDQKH
ncbi:MAG: MotA/TolQ/ExbB proton channel family protein [Bacteroidia bacterium]